MKEERFRFSGTKGITRKEKVMCLKERRGDGGYGLLGKELGFSRKKNKRERRTRLRGFLHQIREPGSDTMKDCVNAE